MKANLYHCTENHVLKLLYRIVSLKTIETIETIENHVLYLCARGHPSPSHSSLAALTPQSIRPGYWITSLLSYGFQGNAGPTKPLRFKPSPAPPELYDSLTDTCDNVSFQDVLGYETDVV